MLALAAGFGLRPVDGINILILLVLVWILVRVINDPNNLIVWADYISTRGSDAKQHGDLNKLLQLMGGVVACITVLLYAGHATVDGLGLAGVLGVVLGFCAGPVMWAAKLRAQQGTVTTTTEPVADPVPQKTTVQETPPIAEKKGNK